MNGSAILLSPDVESDAFEATASGLFLPAHIVRRPKGVDLFAGAGGFSLGFVQAGFEIVAAVDHDPVCAITYMQNLGSYPCKFHFVDPSDSEALEAQLQKLMKGKNGRGFPVSGGGYVHHAHECPGVGHFFLGDVRKLSGWEILEGVDLEPGELDCVIGGPPCGGFSTAGKRNIADPRNNLVFEFARLVCEMQPKTMVMENVPGILSMITPEGLPVVDVLCRILEDGGFGTVDAVKRSLLSHPDARALMRGKKGSKGERKPHDANAPEPAPEDLGPLFAEGDR